MLRVLAHPLAGSPEREHRLQELFCKAAQAGAAEGPGEAAHAQVTLGRGGSSTLQLGSGDCTLVSRKHAKLRLEWPESEPASSGASAGSLQPRLHILSVGTNGACVFHEAVAAEEGFNWRCLRRPSVLIDIPKGVWCPIYGGLAQQGAAGVFGLPHMNDR